MDGLEQKNHGGGVATAMVVDCVVVGTVATAESPSDLLLLLPGWCWCCCCWKWRRAAWWVSNKQRHTDRFAEQRLFWRAQK